MQYSFIKKILSSEATLSSFNLLTKPISFFNFFIVVHSLSLHDFGIYKLVLSFYALVSGLSINFIDNLVLNEMGIFQGENKFWKVKKIFKEYLLLKILIGFSLTAIVYFFADEIGGEYGMDIGYWIKIISFLFILDGIKSIFNIFFQYRLKFFIYSSYAFFSELLKLLLLVGFIKYSTLGISQLLLINIFITFVLLIYLGVIFFIQYKKSLSVITDKYKTRRILLVKIIKTYGKWAVIRSYVLNFSQNIRPWIINYFLGAEGVAIFSVAYDFLGNLKSLVSLDSLKTIIPMEIKDKNRTRMLFIRGTKYMTYLYGSFYFLGMLTITVLVYLFLMQYEQSLPYLYIISFTMFFYGMSTIIGRILYSIKKQKELLLLPLINIMSIFILNIVLIPIFGLYGVALEFLISQLLILCVSFLLLIKYKPELKFHFRELIFFDDYDRKILKRGYYFLKEKLKYIKL